MSHANDSYLNSSCVLEENEIEEEHDHTSIDSTSAPLQKSRQQTKKKKATTPFQDSLLDAILNPPFLTITPSETEDPDKAFLLSFLPDIKKLNDNQKMDLKFQFLQALRSITNSTDNAHSQNLNSSNYNSYYTPVNIPPLQHTIQSQIYPHSPMLQNLSNINSYYSLPPKNISQPNVPHPSTYPNQSNSSPYTSKPSDYEEL